MDTDTERIEYELQQAHIAQQQELEEEQAEDLG
jgi:hypothetical protein